MCVLKTFEARQGLISSNCVEVYIKNALDDVISCSRDAIQILFDFTAKCVEIYILLQNVVYLFIITLSVCSLPQSVIKIEEVKLEGARCASVS